MTATCYKCVAQKVSAFLAMGSNKISWAAHKGGHHTYLFKGKVHKNETARCPPVRDWIALGHFKWWGSLDTYLAFRSNYQNGGRGAADGMLRTFHHDKIDTARYCAPPGTTLNMEAMIQRELLRLRPPCLATLPSPGRRLRPSSLS